MTDLNRTFRELADLAYLAADPKFSDEYIGMRFRYICSGLGRADKGGGQLPFASAMTPRPDTQPDKDPGPIPAEPDR
jgi:hypothetical protein